MLFPAENRHRTVGSGGYNFFFRHGNVGSVRFPYGIQHEIFLNFRALFHFRGKFRSVIVCAVPPTVELRAVFCRKRGQIAKQSSLRLSGKIFSFVPFQSNGKFSIYEQFYETRIQFQILRNGLIERILVFEIFIFIPSYESILPFFAFRGRAERCLIEFFAVQHLNVRLRRTAVHFKRYGIFHVFNKGVRHTVVCKLNRGVAVRRLDNRAVRRNQSESRTVEKIRSSDRLSAEFQRKRRVCQLKRISRFSLVGIVRTGVCKRLVVAFGNRRLCRLVFTSRRTGCRRTEHKRETQQFKQ